MTFYAFVSLYYTLDVDMTMDLHRLAEILLPSWGLGPILSSTTPSTGFINRTLLLRTPGGRYALRAYRHRDRLPIEREHALIAYAHARGVPAVPPLPLPSGETILEHEERYYALFPHAPGQQVARDALGPSEVAAMGQALATIHRALHDYSPERVASRDFAFDRATTLARIDGLVAVAEAQPRPTPVDGHALVRLKGRRDWLLSAPDVDLSGWETLERQVIHGDYQEANVFFAAGRVSAVIDWDQSYTAPPAWEIARAFHLALDFSPALCRAFLDAYRARLPLQSDDLDAAATYYAVFRAHDLWVYDAVYLERDDRVRTFIYPGGFVPLIDRWDTLKAALPLTTD